MQPLQINSQLYRTDPHIPLFTSAWRAIFLRVAHAAGMLHKVRSVGVRLFLSVAHAVTWNPVQAPVALGFLRLAR